MIKKLICTIIIVGVAAVKAQKSTPEQYVQQYAALAQMEMKRTGVPAAITLAQGILESESGNSELASKSNNHFGIKCKTEWTGEKVYHNDDARGECFRKYDNVAQSYIDHSDFLKTRTHYAFLFELEPTDYFGWAKGLKQAGYATSPTYAQKLIGLIEKYELHRYNDLSTFKDDTAEATKMAVASPVAAPAVQATQEVEEVSPAPMSSVEQDPLSKDLAQQYEQKTTQINGVKAVRIMAGTSILAVAEQYKLSLSKLLEYNDLPSTTADILPVNTILFLQKKKKQGNNPTHIVRANETLHQIAQEEGVRLESILRMNKLEQTAKLKTGDIIKLK